MPLRRRAFHVQFRGADVGRYYVPPSGVSYGLDYEIVSAAVACGVPPSLFRGWPVADQEEVLAQQRLEARIQAVLRQESMRQAKQQSRRR